MIDLHNTAIKKNAAEIFETNNYDESINKVNPVLQPVVHIQPSINIVKSLADNDGSTTTIYTTPTDKDFYLTNIGVAISPTDGTGYAKVIFIIRDGTSQVYEIFADNSGAVGDTTPIPTNGNIMFPLRGILLEKNSAIVTEGSGNTHNFIICGYVDSDRSGI